MCVCACGGGSVQFSKGVIIDLPSSSGLPSAFCMERGAGDAMGDARVRSDKGATATLATLSACRALPGRCVVVKADLWCHPAHVPGEGSPGPQGLTGEQPKGLIVAPGIGRMRTPVLFGSLGLSDGSGTSTLFPGHGRSFCATAAAGHATSTADGVPADTTTVPSTITITTIIQAGIVPNMC